ncbi:bifunctional adenosylcobinamide kinase/adenosylcobinamide-phosphate guanylyltransferase [Desulfosporosinus sp. BICA1-9]|uniref:bifunctional adenosylcobinamide kinase/adenosylcobinamide-phosphate guanylyltransferase n=1 Tax=Desulfosporosinus sp. BICA1-9 TaxID=1531958 RepID=UPI00054B0276|nr:bifunctional adenosylcobinamide kinase/adenosylcobinamide-phosphate guanylyltransferase [Desulfosporosinus sp. BICA1-9]KJS48833.1 MAG: adenosylcobinamide kinase [Peptococcaceae bacterium BRH_c23]KJS87076.1 MAG: adenosylcobinamide kinase [Desulfosporosinus sp. BICA1-9]HBW34176.1 bifunctional adenosylcobinamide kinase/adenosylcobinamide-phosphate guanylyltransferase [Desulfosporosinus sp.]
MSQFTLITGGARSGKSSFAELLAASAKLPVTYIATAQIWDEEMAHRVKKHQNQRPATWQLIEEPLNIRETLCQLKDDDGVILLDCVTLWLTNLLLAEQTRQAERVTLSGHEEDNFVLDSTKRDKMFPDIEPTILATVQEVALLAQEIKPQVLFVTNEVGQGIVPENPLARAYRDLAGRSNQILARCADHVYLVVAGYPLELKHSGGQLLASLHKE